VRLSADERVRVQVKYRAMRNVRKRTTDQSATGIGSTSAVGVETEPRRGHVVWCGTGLPCALPPTSRVPKIDDGCVRGRVEVLPEVVPRRLLESIDAAQVLTEAPLQFDVTPAGRAWSPGFRVFSGLAWKVVTRKVTVLTR
jgi:hypothetical protein